MSSGVLISGIAVACVLAALGVALGRVLRIRRSRERFAAYAHDRGLEPSTEDPPGVLPILHRGVKRITKPAFQGELSEGREGTIAHHMHTEQVPVGGGGNSGSGIPSSTQFDLTVVLLEVPEVADAIPKLLCHGRHGGENTDRFDDALGRRGLKRLKLESAALNRRFEIFHSPDQDPVQLRRLFSPAFIVWLAESMPTAFELVNGHLCCFVAGHLDSATELDGLIWGAAELAWRLESESTG